MAPTRAKSREGRLLWMSCRAAVRRFVVFVVACRKPSSDSRGHKGANIGIEEVRYAISCGIVDYLIVVGE